MSAVFVRRLHSREEVDDLENEIRRKAQGLPL